MLFGLSFSWKVKNCFDIFSNKCPHDTVQKLHFYFVYFFNMLSAKYFFFPFDFSQESFVERIGHPFLLFFIFFSHRGQKCFKRFLSMQLSLCEISNFLTTKVLGVSDETCHIGRSADQIG